MYPTSISENQIETFSCAKKWRIDSSYRTPHKKAVPARPLPNATNTYGGSGEIDAIQRRDLFFGKLRLRGYFVDEEKAEEVT